MALFCVNIVDVEAYRHNGYVLTGGVGNYGHTNRFYYVDTSCNNAANLVQNIDSAWYDWINTDITTPISVLKTTTQSQSSFDFYYEDISVSGITLYGVTYFYRNSDPVTLNPDVKMPIEDWGWTQIKLDDADFLSMSSNYNGLNLQKGVVAHEIGHAMGLWHVGDNSKLMNVGGSTLVDKCTSDELNGINDLY